MAESDEQQQNQQPSATLRNRRTTVEDAESDSDIATTTATSVSSTKLSSPSSSASKNDTEDDKKKKTAATQIHKRIAQQQGKKNSQIKNLVISLIVASIGVLLKSAFEKFILTGREIAIEQTVGLQGNCFKTACKFAFCMRVFGMRR